MTREAFLMRTKRRAREIFFNIGRMRENFPLVSSTRDEFRRRDVDFAGNLASFERGCAMGERGFPSPIRGIGAAGHDAGLGVGVACSGSFDRDEPGSGCR